LTERRFMSRDDHGYSRRQVNAENDACGWRKVGKVEGQVDPSHDAEAGWERDQYGGPTVGSGPKEKRPNREAVAEGVIRKVQIPYGGETGCA
jgi:hypothetical protein